MRRQDLARYDGDQTRVDEFVDAQRTLNDGMKELGVGAADANGLFLEARACLNHPKTDDQIPATGEATMAALQERYGAQTDKVIAGAQRVVSALEAKVPGVREFLANSGMGNYPKVVDACVRVARRNGWA